MSSSQNIDRTPAYTLNEIAKKKKAGIVVSGWHKEITDLLMESAKSTLLNAGLDPENMKFRELLNCLWGHNIFWNMRKLILL